jgi:hypothetical protein
VKIRQVFVIGSKLRYTGPTIKASEDKQLHPGTIVTLRLTDVPKLTGSGTWAWVTFDSPETGTELQAAIKTKDLPKYLRPPNA